MVQAAAGELELTAELVELLDQLVQSLADNGILHSTNALQMGKVGVGGWDALQHTGWPEINGSGTSVSGEAADRNQR